MKIIIDNVLSDEKTISRAFNLSEELVKKDGNKAVITTERIELIKNSEFYKLKRNETLSSICKRYMIPEVVMKKANHDIYITCGVTVYIPKFFGMAYVVSPLDTLSSISKRFKLTEKELSKRNEIDYLFPGLVLDVTKEREG